MPEKNEKIVLKIINCGIAPYAEVLALQHDLRDKRREGTIANTALLVEHKPVITLGARQTANRLTLANEHIERQGIEIVNIRRGGGATAHNPGQIVVYPILNLSQLGLGVSDYIHTLENIGVTLLAQLGVEAEAKKGFPGLWVGPRKIASIGVRVSKMVSYHGMALNIQNDLSIFNCIIPCGLDGVTMTSAQQITGKQYDMEEVKQILSKILQENFAKDGKTEYQKLSQTARLA